MRYSLILVSIFLIACQTMAQPKSSEVIQLIESLSDQFDNNHKFNGETITVVFVPGVDDPFTKVYDKWKDKSWQPDAKITVVGGFKEMLAGGGHGAPSDGIKKHVQDAFIARYGKGHFPILIDLMSETGVMLGVKGLSIIKINVKTKTIESIQDFGDNRKKFFDNVNPLFKQ
jgi:hypothetical protein